MIYSYYSNNMFRLDLPEHDAGWYSLRINIAGNGYSKAKWYEIYLE